MKRTATQTYSIALSAFVLLSLSLQTGCITYSHHAIPADRLPHRVEVLPEGLSSSRELGAPRTDSTAFLHYRSRRRTRGLH